MREGRWIGIPEVEIRFPSVSESNHKWVKFTSFNSMKLEGRPTRVLKRFIDLGFMRDWWNEKIFEDLIVFGWDRKYLKSDAPILTLPFKYFIKDMGYTKETRLKEVDNNGTG